MDLDILIAGGLKLRSSLTEDLDNGT